MRSPGSVATSDPCLSYAWTGLPLHPFFLRDEQGPLVDPVDAHMHVGHAAPRALKDRAPGANVSVAESDPAMAVDAVLAMLDDAGVSHLLQVTPTVDGDNSRSTQLDPDWEHADRSMNSINEGYRRFFLRYMREELAGHPNLQEPMTPDYPPYGKRILLDNG